MCHHVWHSDLYRRDMKRPTNYTLRHSKAAPIKSGVSASRKPVPNDEPKKVAYIRVSSDDQKTAMRDDAIAKAGCDLVFREKASGRKTDRPELAKALAACNDGDSFIVWRLDRLGRLVEIVQLVDDLQARGVTFVSLTEGFDVSTMVGKLVRNILASVAEYEVELITERVRAGVQAAKLAAFNSAPVVR